MQYSKFGNVIRNIQNKLGKRALKSDLKSTVINEKNPKITDRPQCFARNLQHGVHAIFKLACAQYSTWCTRNIQHGAAICEKVYCKQGEASLTLIWHASHPTEVAHNYYS